MLALGSWDTLASSGSHQVMIRTAVVLAGPHLSGYDETKHL